MTRLVLEQISSMSSTSSINQSPKLSICISTLNRASFIGETLESIVSQATQDLEILVLDAGSTDRTEDVVSEYARCYPGLRYVKQATNNGIDQDFDHAVELARGKYCWLMPDDDLMKPGSVAAVLEAIGHGYSVVLVNVEAKDVAMSCVLMPSGIDFSADRVYGPSEMDALFESGRKLLGYTGSVVMERALWLARDRERYYGSWFIFIGVIFQERLPGNALIVAAPCISIRIGNQSWLAKYFEIAAIRYRSLVWSLPLAESTKNKICGAAPWTSFCGLMFYRAVGAYSFIEYRRYVRPRLRSLQDAIIPMLVAVMPGVIANTILVLKYSVRGRRDRGVDLVYLRQSRFYLWRRCTFR